MEGLNLSPVGQVRCHNFGTTNFNSTGISTVPGGTVQTKIFNTNQTGLDTNSNLFRNVHWSLRFSCTAARYRSEILGVRTTVPPF